MPTWTDQDRSRLLLAIIELLVPPRTHKKLPPWNEVAERMGAGFTQEAVRQQYQKLRKEGLPGSGSVPNTPQRNRLSQPAGITKTPTNRRKRLFKSEQDDEEDSESKRVKVENEESGFGSRVVLKIESVDEDGIVNLEDDELSGSPVGNVFA